MRRPAARIAFAVLMAALLLFAPAATLCASCCVEPAQALVGAPPCCGCDGSFSRPAPIDRTAIHSRRAPLAAPAPDSPALVGGLAWVAIPPLPALSPLPGAPPPPFPRRL
jgi:hypothetical protein